MDLERWKKINNREQLLHIRAELIRAGGWQRKDKNNFLLALERALELIDLTISDEKWKENILMPLRLREEVAKFYALQRTDDISLLYNVL